MIDEKEWVWMPHAVHFIFGDECRFRLNTRVGDYIISTVGEYLPDAPVREILAQCRKIDLEGIGDERVSNYMKKIGCEDIGFNRKYETMVFYSKPSENNDSCCPWEAVRSAELDMIGYSDPGEAYRGHLEMCRKFAHRL